jgi:hypothetical protein
MRFGQVRAMADRGAAALGRFLAPVEIAQQVAEIGQRLGKCRLEADRLAIGGLGIGAAAENRHGLAIDARLTRASGTAEREAALDMIDDRPGRHPVTLGADKASDAAEFFGDQRERNVTPHVAQNISGRRSAIDGRTTRRGGYTVSQRIRKRIEEISGWTTASAGFRKTRHRGVERVGWFFTLTVAAYNLVRLPKILAEAA